MTTVAAGMDTCPDWAPFFGYLGAMSCAVLSNWGSAWGTWKAGLGVCHMGIDYSKGVIKNIVPIVMAGVLGIYGLIVSVIIVQSILPPDQNNATTYSVFNGYSHLAAGLCCGLSCLAAGGTIGVIGDVGTRGFGLKASGGKRCWQTGDMGGGADDGGGGGESAMRDSLSAEEANKLYVGLLIMLIFSEALALYGLIVALILSQNSYYCGK